MMEIALPELNHSHITILKHIKPNPLLPHNQILQTRIKYKGRFLFKSKKST